MGDIVHLSCNEVIPADIILLHSSDDSGICHIDTSNLDGENNLKQRQIVWGLRSVINTLSLNIHIHHLARIHARTDLILTEHKKKENHAVNEYN